MGRIFRRVAEARQLTSSSSSFSWAARWGLVAILTTAAFLADRFLLPQEPLPIVYVPGLLFASTFNRPRMIGLLGVLTAVLDYVSSLQLPSLISAVGTATLLGCVVLAAFAAHLRIKAEHNARVAEEARHHLVEFQDMVVHDLLAPITALRLRLDRARRGHDIALELDALDRSLH